MARTGEESKGQGEEEQDSEASTRSPLFYIGFDLSGKRPGGVQKRVVSSRTARFCGEAVGCQSSAM